MKKEKFKKTKESATGTNDISEEYIDYNFKKVNNNNSWKDRRSTVQFYPKQVQMGTSPMAK